MALDVLEEGEPWSEDRQRLDDVGPQVAVVEGAAALAGVTEWLTRVAARQHVHGLHLGPVDFSDVAEVRHVRVVVGENRDGSRLNVGHPGERAAQRGLNGHVEAAVQ